MFKEKTCSDMNGQDLRELQTPPYTVDLSPLSETSIAKMTSIFESDVTIMALV